MDIEELLEMARRSHSITTLEGTAAKGAEAYLYALSCVAASFDATGFSGDDLHSLAEVYYAEIRAPRAGQRRQYDAGKAIAEETVRRLQG